MMVKPLADLIEFYNTKNLLLAVLMLFSVIFCSTQKK